MQNITLNPISIEDKEVIRNLVFEYQQELLDTENPGEYTYLDTYWEKENRHPFFIKHSDEIIGFVLVNHHTLINKPGANIAEFYVKPDYRHNGVGLQAALAVFSKFPGKWEVRVLHDKFKAIEFWRKTIDKATKGDFQETNSNPSALDWIGPIFLFTITTDKVKSTASIP